MSTTTEIDNPESPMTWSKCFASLKAGTIIDVVHPVTGLTHCYGRDLANVREEYPDAQLMTVDDWCKAKAATQDTPVAWEAITEEQYWYWLECVPPACMLSGSFLVGEPSDHHALTGAPRYQAVICHSAAKDYRASNRPMTVKEFKQLFAHRSASVAADLAAQEWSASV